MHQSSFTFGSVIVKISTVCTAVRKVQFAVAVFVAVFPLTDVKAVFVQLKWCWVK
jgi:hypothetical protein